MRLWQWPEGKAKMICGGSHLSIIRQQGISIGSLTGGQMDRVHGTKCNLGMATQDDPVGPLQDGFVYGHHPEHTVCEITLQFLPGGATHST